MTSVLLLATALAAGPDSLPPVPFTETVRETVYIERVITERRVNPSAVPEAVHARDDSRAVKYILSALFVGAGAYLVVHGEHNPRYKLVYGLGGLRLAQQRNPEVYLGAGLVTTGIFVLAF